MTTKPVLAAAIAAAFAVSGGAIAAGQDKQSSQKQSSQSASGGTARPGAPMIVLVPTVVASAPDFSNGCWARLYDSTDFRGNTLSLVGPVDMPDMRTAFGTDWSGEFDSVAVGPKARLTVYDNENYREKAATFKPGQKVADLDEKMGFFEDISSVKIACTGGTPTAQSGQKSGADSAATGGTSDKPQESSK
jgi:hypothetical protein